MSVTFRSSFVMLAAGVAALTVAACSKPETASAPAENPVHPGELLASIYHAVGLFPRRTVLNHLNQPREMVKYDAVMDLFA